MSAPLDQYYANELQYLAEAGREFAKKHPQQAALLHPDNVAARDPNVERLFENFAFLTASIRARLDDELPELSQPLLGLLAPHFTRPVPAMATVQLMPDFAQLSKPARVAPGAMVTAEPLVIAPSMFRLSCPFRTCYAVDLVPMRLASAKLRGPTEGGHVLELAFEPCGSAKLKDLRFDRVRLHLCGESHQLVYSLYYHLLQRVKRVEWRTDVAKQPDLVGGGAVSGSIEPVGFARDEEVIPYDVHSFPGFRLLHEYFCFPEKFFYIDLCGLNRLPAAAPGKRLIAEIRFDGEVPAWWTLSEDHFRMFCTPVINLYDEHAFPIDFNQRVTEYPIFIDKDCPEAHRVHSVRSVHGRASESAGEGRTYRPFYDFRHGEPEDDAFYHVVTRRTPTGDHESILSLVAAEGAPAELPTQVLTVDVACFNGDFPSQLRPGDIKYRGDGMPHLIVGARNLAPPTPVRRPAMGADFTWYFLSHLALNRLSMTDVDTMTAMLRLYDWTGDPANERRIAGLKHVTVTDQRALVVRRGVPVHGMEVVGGLDESCFTDVGDAFLFSQVWCRFLALYATVNSFVRLRVRCTGSKTEWAWPAMDGRQTTL